MASYAAAAATAALLCAKVVNVETQPEQELAWLEFAPRHLPSASVLVSTPNVEVAPGGCLRPHEDGASVSGSEPRSGVCGLSPFQVRFRLLENGWAALPIVRHDAREKDAGKKPSIAGWNDFAEYAAALPTADDLAGWESGNHRAPEPGSR